MKPVIDIHPELRSVKAHVLPTNKWMLATMQASLRLVNRIHRRRFTRLITLNKIRSEDGHLVPILIIRPESAPVPMPALVYFHGGAYVMEGAPQHTENAVHYATQLNCTVIFVDYRLAPWHPFPAGFNDCFAALLWTGANALQLGVDAKRIAVGGDSAGGNLAAGIAQRAVQELGFDLRGQLLIYPAADLLCDRPSMTMFKDVPPFKKLDHLQVTQTYLGRTPSRPLPQYASPMEGSLKGLPPTYIETPQYDPLHDQGVEYAAALKRAGVTVALNDIPGAIHGFDVVAANSTLARDAIAQRVAFLRQIFE